MLFGERKHVSDAASICMTFGNSLADTRELQEREPDLPATSNDQATRGRWRALLERIAGKLSGLARYLFDLVCHLATPKEWKISAELKLPALGSGTIEVCFGAEPTVGHGKPSLQPPSSTATLMYSLPC